jgi:DNA-binding IclR family transcriptional regulator
VLESRRYVERSPSGNEFRLGLRLFELGARAVARINAVETARPFLQRLVQESGETAHLGILRQGEIVSIANVESHQTLRTPATVGKRAPLHCSSQGKCILAFLPEDAVKNLFRRRALEAFTPRTITSLDALRRRLEHTRTHGYALDDEEFETGLRCVGAPVRDHSGQVVAAMSIAGPAFRLTRDRLPDLIGLVKQTAAEFSHALGYSPDTGA